MPPLLRTKPQRTGKIHRGHLHDLSRGLGQQMFFWGRDVLTDGNLLLAFGFEKTPSPGLKGTSCYRVPWKDGIIELHGACAGWYPNTPSRDPGFLFIRTRLNCSTHRFSSPVVPGDYPDSGLSSSPLNDLVDASRTFITWLCHYEQWIEDSLGPKHREGCYRMFKKLPASAPWLPPGTARQWLASFANANPALTRARRLHSR